MRQIYSESRASLLRFLHAPAWSTITDPAEV